MLPVIPSGGHTAYQDFFVDAFTRLHMDPFSIPRSTWRTIIEFWYLDLSLTDTSMLDCYSPRGPQPRLPSNMLRSYLLSIKLKVTSITLWVNTLKVTPLYAVMSGFDPDDVPGVGTFYDFFGRLWGSDSNNFSPKKRYRKKKTPKGKKSGEKTPNIDSSMSARLIRFFKKHPLPDSSGSPIGLIFRLYKAQFLDVSVGLGLLDPSRITLAGDGTPVRTSARPRYKKICGCGREHCGCKRKFSQPDCNTGWDSSRDCYFNGYHLYIFVASDSPNDLPVFPLLGRASRHDMMSFLHTFFTMESWLPDYKVAKLLLDSAHDSDAVYRFCNERDIQPFIDLNKGNLGQFIYQDTFYLDEFGTPVCVKTGKKFHRDGSELNRKRWKWRCPLAGKAGCRCATPCSDSPYGRTVHTRTADDPRLINDPPRGSDAWILEYNGRTSVERFNKREKEDYKLEDGRHRSTKMWYCRLHAIMMLQHLDAWEMPPAEAFRDFVAKHTA